MTEREAWRWWRCPDWADDTELWRSAVEEVAALDGELVPVDYTDVERGAERLRVVMVEAARASWWTATGPIAERDAALLEELHRPASLPAASPEVVRR